MFVASYAHYSTNFNSDWKFVDNEKESVDLFILNHTRKGDVVVTQDIGLASMLLSKSVHVLSPRGTLFQNQQIDLALHSRYLSQRARRAGHYTKGPKPFTAQDRIRFIHSFEEILSKLAGKSSSL